ncbi:hypothetical protein D0808_15460 [Bacillus subtilis]|uniref:DUF6022 family protein n=1 Tax=Bacillus subtilis TaxID=1423 RepID=UPI001292DE94|nr:DUF6022 family protein [Bacillus subtilis]QFY82698.1 hypothetical protein D0808_15460 [Bacillus subtilis]
MKTWNEFFLQNQEITIHRLAKYFNQYVQQQWDIILKKHHDELIETFKKIGEPTYGVYLKKLLQPIMKQLMDEGYLLKTGFIMPNSIEHWGPPEERERCMWCVVKNEDEMPLGTLVLRMFHSHTAFDVPRAPDFLALEQIEKEAIIEAISKASIRLNRKDHGFVPQDRKNKEIQRWEYSAETGLSDYLTSNQDALEVSYLDYALSQWGKQGWELTSVVPYEGRLVAFFKRPL